MDLQNNKKFTGFEKSRQGRPVKELKKANKEERAKLWRKQYYEKKKKLEKEQDERVMIIIKNIVEDVYGKKPIVENNISTP